MAGASSPVISQAPSNKVALRTAVGDWLAGGAAHAAPKRMSPDRMIFNRQHGHLRRHVDCLSLAVHRELDCWRQGLLMLEIRQSSGTSAALGRSDAVQVNVVHVENAQQQIPRRDGP